MPLCNILILHIFLIFVYIVPVIKDEKGCFFPWLSGKQGTWEGLSNLRALGARPWSTPGYPATGNSGKTLLSFGVDAVIADND